jgi:ABC-type sulfate transport system permease component
MKNIKRDKIAHLQACLCAPFAVFPIVYLYFYLLSYWSESIILSEGGIAIFWTACVGYIVALVITLIYGLPVALVLQTKQRFTPKLLAILSLLPLMIVSVFYGESLDMFDLFIYCSFGVSFAYWCFYKWSASGI